MPANDFGSVGAAGTEIPLAQFVKAAATMQLLS